ncbi:MAG: cbb3-type cytochrome c oxidase subunit 3 [Paracoccaceae bacterium]
MDAANSTYQLLREFADSWFLLAMVLFFVGMVLYTLRPGAKATHDDIANIPLRNDTPRAAACDETRD